MPSQTYDAALGHKRGLKRTRDEDGPGEDTEKPSKVSPTTSVTWFALLKWSTRHAMSHDTEHHLLSQKLLAHTLRSPDMRGNRTNKRDPS